MRLKITLLVLLLSPFFKSLAQENQFSIGTHFPLYYTIGYEEKIYKNWFLNMQLGWLDEPYDKFLLDQAKKSGGAIEIIEVISGSFRSAYCFQPTLKYRFKHFYIGGFYSFAISNATKIDFKKVANYYDKEIPEYISIPGTTYTIPFPYIEVAMKTTLQNAGILLGKEFRFKNPKYAIGVEVSFTKILKTKQEMILNDYEEFVPADLKKQIYDDINNYLKQNSNLPTLNLFFVYRFNKSINGLFSK
jgi:hypothetical protein